MSRSALVRQLNQLAGGKATVRSHAERPWRSITFNGTRHHLQLRFEGDEACAAGEAMIEALPEHVFTLRRQMVADAAVVWAASGRMELGGVPWLEVSAEVLVLDGD